MYLKNMFVVFKIHCFFFDNFPINLIYFMDLPIIFLEILVGTNPCISLQHKQI